MYIELTVTSNDKAIARVEVEIPLASEATDEWEDGTTYIEDENAESCAIESVYGYLGYDSGFAVRVATTDDDDAELVAWCRKPSARSDSSSADHTFLGGDVDLDEWRGRSILADVLCTD